jgi:2-polyprenyl-3-methyl-5-hydroxy-6-metoxy-1,4-benzoquinol methylase
VNTLAIVNAVYKKETLAAKFHIFGRAVMCPFYKMLPYFPGSGQILDIGCGHGILSNLLFYDPHNNGRRLMGIDHAPDKVDIARRCSVRSIEFLTASPDSLPDKKFDAVSMVDVLYAVDIDKWKALLDSCFRILKPGGLFIVKEVIDKPRWKYLALLLEEKLAVEVLKITKGDRPHIESANTYRKALKESGFFIVEEKPLEIFNWVNHYVFIARRAS